MPSVALACLIVVLFAAFVGIVVALQRRLVPSLEGTKRIWKGRAKAVVEPPRPKSESFPRFQASLRECAKWLESRPELRKHAAKFDELGDDLAHPLMVVVMGQFNTGKSTFINCLLGERLLVSDVRPATAAVTLLTYGEVPALVAHRKDGAAQEFPFEALAEASAEGSESGIEIRRDLSHLEVRLPSPLLRRVTLIDTPGLNSPHASHTEATTSFVRRADAIVWLLASGQAGTASEDADIKRLARDLKPLVVVNGIDTIDEEEESVEDTLRRIGKRLGTETPMGISALYGLEAIESADDDLRRRSGLTGFLEHFNDGFLRSALDQRGERARQRTALLLAALGTDLKHLSSELSTSQANARGGQGYAQSQSEAISSLQAEKSGWERARLKIERIKDKSYYGGDGLETHMTVVACPRCGGTGRCVYCTGTGRQTSGGPCTYCEGGSKPCAFCSGKQTILEPHADPCLRGRSIIAIHAQLDRDFEGVRLPYEMVPSEVGDRITINRTIGLLNGNLDGLASNLSGLRSQFDDVRAKRKDYEKDRSAYSARKSTYDQGGFVAKALSFNERAVLQELEKGLASHDASIKAEERILAQQLDSIGQRLVRLAGERFVLTAQAISGMDQAIVIRQVNIREHETRIEAARINVERLSWVPEATAWAEERETSLMSKLATDIGRHALDPFAQEGSTRSSAK